MKKILIGNSFPMSLVRREVRIVPGSIDQLKHTLEGVEIHSFWGHRNTLETVQKETGLDLRPASERPVLLVDDSGFPWLNGFSFRECWIVAPRYHPGTRPRIGEEVHEEDIDCWQVLQMIWKTSHGKNGE